MAVDSVGNIESHSFHPSRSWVGLVRLQFIWGTSLICPGKQGARFYSGALQPKP